MPAGEAWRWSSLDSLIARVDSLTGVVEGHGAKWDEQAMKAMATNKPVTIGAKEPHFLHAASRVVLEVQGTGPFAITYVDPKDDPRTGSTP
jgi:hypothetical protein